MAQSWIMLASMALHAAAAPAPPSSSIALSIPVNCTIGGQCLVQKLFDHDPTAARRDYRCGVLTTDGHDGMDFRVRTMADMRAGVAVIAAADGTVLRVRDGEPDISVKVRKDLNGRDAGNGVVIDHGNGWMTQYSHLRLGSVEVKPGQRVQAGDRLGLIGMSGNAEFPHLHFAVRLQDKSVDPFTGPVGSTDCKGKQAPAGSLWTSRAAQALSYQPTAVIAVDLAAAVPPASVADRSAPARPQQRTDPIIVWADIFGSMAGDMQRFRIIGPDQQSILDQSKTLDQGHLSWFSYAGRRPPEGGWKQGRYIATYELMRGGRIIDRGRSEMVIR
ncbi:M23 family peptidase [Sphingobium lactosutens]|uniref:M23 family metallopeptidase n=1 Tax=Sphingobium lactosutens TaxID=522773 RepID=UPI001C4AA772|nr:M23 family metallopeptidase [Sphingobium lactosutens]NWK95999.1 M23 family peptidase [Sphingobium lactosutens]